MIDSFSHNGHSKQDKMKPLSASEEKKLDLYAARYEEYAKETLLQQVTSTTPHSDTTPTPTGQVSPTKSFFSLNKKSPKTPAPTRPTFSEGIPPCADMTESISPEEQQVYNVLIATRSSSEIKASPEIITSPIRMTTFSAPDTRRTKTDTLKSDTSSRSNTSRTSMNTTSTVNIRKPRGIPGRGPMASTWNSTTTSESTNPLRRLRESQAVPAMVSRNSTTGRDMGNI